MPNKIKLIGYGHHEEANAAEALNPGHLVEIDSSGEVQKHATEGGLAERLFAKEDALQGKTVDDAYAADDVVSIHAALPGDNVWAYLQAGQNVAIGDKLISGGDGTLIEDGQEGSATTVRQAVAVALEALDLSASGAVDTRLAVRVL